METNTQIVVKKTPVMIRREMVNNPAVLNALEPVERAVFLASTDKTISEYTGPQLAAELKNVLFFIAKDVGYRITDEQDRQYMIIRTAELLKRYYSNLTLKDFRMAFEMSITGQLDEFLPKGRDGQPDRGHYQQFNAEYVCKILDAYKARRGWILKKAHEAVPRKETPVDPGMKEEYRKHAIRELVAHFEIFRDTNMLSTSPLLDVVFYNILSEYGVAVPVDVTLEEQKYVWQQSINEFARRGMVGDLNRLKGQGPDAPELETAAYSMARHKALRKTFSMLIEQGKHVQDFIQNER